MAETSSRLLQYTGAATAAAGMLALSAVVASSAAVGAVASSLHTGKTILKDAFKMRQGNADPENTDMAVVPAQPAEMQA